MVARQSQAKMTTQRDRHDFGALEQRVYGAERKIDDLSAQTSSQISNLRTELGGSIDNIARKIDAQQERWDSTRAEDARQAANAAIASRTDWKSILGVTATIGALMLGFATAIGVLTVTPINTTLSEHREAQFTEARERKDDIAKVYLTLAPIAAIVAQHDNDLRRMDADEKLIGEKWSKDAQTEYVKGQDKLWALEHEYAVRDLARVETHVDSVDGQQIKRPEVTALLAAKDALIASQNERTDAISRNLEDFRKEYGSAYTQGDEIKALRTAVESIMSRLFSLFSPPSNGPPAIIPLTPVAPAK